MLPNRSMTPILIVLALILSFVGGIALWYFGIRERPTESSTNTNTQQTAIPEQSDATTRAVQTPASQQADRDRDGMADDAENAAGTDPDKPDTDGDELTDREETSVYRTKPLDGDSDGDGTDDGAEVHAGQNPNGVGALLDIPAAIQALNAAPQPQGQE